MFAFALAMAALHTGSPVPHWLVLLAVVPVLWVVIGAGVVIVDRLLRAVG